MKSLMSDQKTMFKSKNLHGFSVFAFSVTIIAAFCGAMFINGNSKLAYAAGSNDPFAPYEIQSTAEAWVAIANYPLSPYGATTIVPTDTARSFDDLGGDASGSSSFGTSVTGVFGMVFVAPHTAKPDYWTWYIDQTTIPSDLDIDKIYFSKDPGNASAWFNATALTTVTPYAVGGDSTLGGSLVFDISNIGAGAGDTVHIVGNKTGTGYLIDTREMNFTFAAEGPTAIPELPGGMVGIFSLLMAGLVMGLKRIIFQPAL